MNATLQLPIEMFPMVARDLDAVSRLEQQVQAFPWSLGNFADSLAAGHGMWVCRVGGDLVGYFIIMVVADEAHLLNVAVSLAYQGRGFGARLLQQALAEAKGHGATRFFLEVRPSNQRALALYRLFGFRQIGCRRGYYPAAEGREDALIFERQLA